MVGEFVLWWCLNCGPFDKPGKIDRPLPNSIVRTADWLPMSVKRSVVTAAVRRGLFDREFEGAEVEGYWIIVNDPDGAYEVFRRPDDFAEVLSTVRARSIGKPWPDDVLFDEFFRPDR